MQRETGQAIVVTSGKGGTGKTTSVGAIASCLAALGYKTLCIDCDVGLKNLDLTLGLSDMTLSDFNDCINGTKSLSDAAVGHPKIENLYFISAPSTLKPENIDREKMRDLISEAKKQYDYCLIDSPAGMGAGFELAAAGADMAIIVATGDLSSIRDGQRVSAELASIGIQNVRLLVNRVKPKLFRRTKSTVDHMIDSVGAQLLGVISEDENVILAANLETPLILFENRKAAKQFLNVAKRITGQRVPLGRV